MWKTSPEWYYDEPVPFDESGPVNVKPIVLLCGNIAEFDYSSGISYRCTACMAVVGSVAMPRECKALYEMEEVVDKLKGKK